jgi:cation diffusion facilitator family transporter
VKALADPKRVPLTRFAWLSIGAALLTIALKTTAFFLTGSVGLLSDTLESSVNLISAIFALLALRLLERPPDDEFSFGYSKIEYFSSGFEGGMILLAAIGIIISAVPRLIEPQPLEQLGVGLAISVIASLINFGVARVLGSAASRFNSITLEADSKHLMTDVFTTGGVLVGVGLVWVTGFLRLDAVVALIVAANILYTGFKLLRRSGRGLMDAAIPPEELNCIKSILDSLKVQGVGYHALRTRQAASRRFIVVHLMVPGNWSVRQGHQMAEHVERWIRESIPETNVVTHIEPIEDPVSLMDEEMFR